MSQQTTSKRLRVFAIVGIVITLAVAIAAIYMAVTSHTSASAPETSGLLPKPTEVQAPQMMSPLTSDVPLSDNPTPPPVDNLPWPDKDNVDKFNDTVCSVGVTAAGPKVLTVSRVMPTVPDLARRLVVGYQGLFTEGIRNNGNPTITGFTSHLDNSLGSPGPVEYCNFPRNAIDSSRISAPPASIANTPSVVCIVSYFDRTDVALTLSDGKSYIASSDTNNKYVLPGDKVQLTTNGWSVDVTGYSTGDFTSSCQTLVLSKTTDLLTPPTS